MAAKVIAAAWPTFNESTPARTGMRTWRLGRREGTAAEARTLRAEHDGQPVGRLELPDALRRRRRGHRPALEAGVAQRWSNTSGQSAASTRTTGRCRISPMLTRIERRLYGSVHVGSITSASMPSAREARAMAPRFSASFSPSSTATTGAAGDDDMPSGRAATAGGRRHDASVQVEADDVGDHFAFGDVHRHAAGRQLVEPRRGSARPATARATPTGPRGRTRCSRSIGHEPFGDEQFVALEPAPERLIVQRPVVVEARVVADGHRVTVTGRCHRVSERTPGSRRRTT